jgi:hypothetical protein
MVVAASVENSQENMRFPTPYTKCRMRPAGSEFQVVHQGRYRNRSVIRQRRPIRICLETRQGLRGGQHR